MRGYSPNSRTNRVRQFFINNPDEALSYSDMAVKFDISVEQAKNVVHELVREGFARVNHVVLITAKEPA